MGVFSNNIENDPLFITEGRQWMTSCILETVAKYFTHNKPYYDDKTEMYHIKQQIICNWMNFAALKQYFIDGTETIVTYSKTPGYKYDVVVNVRFVWEEDRENYVEFVRVPIITNINYELI